MDTDALRAQLNEALDAAMSKDQRTRAARELLINRGIGLFKIAPRPGIVLDEILRTATSAAPTEARREFAVLLIYALAVEGLLPTRGETERHIRSFLEQALLNPLRRAGYPFDGSPYDKRRVLAGLHATVDEYLRPPEPSIPLWLHGVRTRTED